MYFSSEWPLLVICPSSLRHTWAGEIEKWLGIGAENMQIITSGKQKPSNLICIIRFVLCSLFSACTSMCGIIFSLSRTGLAQLFAFFTHTIPPLVLIWPQEWQRSLAVLKVSLYLNLMLLELLFLAHPRTPKYTTPAHTHTHTPHSSSTLVTPYFSISRSLLSSLSLLRVLCFLGGFFNAAARTRQTHTHSTMTTVLLHDHLQLWLWTNRTT